MLRSKTYRKKGTILSPTTGLAAESAEDQAAQPMDGLDFDSHSFCHDPVYRRLLGERLAELEGESDDFDEDEDDRPLRPN